jgi:hypothetical protein
MLAVNNQVNEMYEATEQIQEALNLNNDLAMAARAYDDGVTELYPADSRRAAILRRMIHEERGALTWAEVQQLNH